VRSSEPSLLAQVTEHPGRLAGRVGGVRRGVLAREVADPGRLPRLDGHERRHGGDDRRREVRALPDVRRDGGLLELDGGGTEALGRSKRVAEVRSGAVAGPLAEALEATWRRDPGLYYEDGFQEYADRGGRVGAASVGGLEWVEVDDETDLARAREVAWRC
jgi:hypothetical protein